MKKNYVYNILTVYVYKLQKYNCNWMNEGYNYKVLNFASIYKKNKKHCFIVNLFIALKMYSFDLFRKIKYLMYYLSNIKKLSKYIYSTK